MAGQARAAAAVMAAVRGAGERHWLLGSLAAVMGVRSFERLPAAPLARMLQVDASESLRSCRVLPAQLMHDLG